LHLLGILQIGKPPAGSRSKVRSCCILHPTVRKFGIGHASRSKTAAGGRAPAPPGHLAYSATANEKRAKEEEAPGSAGSAGRQPASKSSRAVAARGHAHRHQPKVTRHGLFPCLCLALAFASPSRLSFPLALRLHQLEPLPSTHHLTSLPSLLLLVPSRQERRAPSRASGRNARAEAPAPVVCLARPRRPSRGSSWRRRGRLRRGRPAVAEADAERSGGAGRRAAAGQGPAPRYYWAFDDARPADSGHRLAMRVRIARCCLCMGVTERVLV